MMPFTCMKKIGRLWCQVRRSRLNWLRLLRFMWKEEKGIVFIRRVKEKESRILVHHQVRMAIREGGKIREEGADQGLTRILSRGRGQEDLDRSHFLGRNQAQIHALIRQEEGSHLSKQLFSFL